MISNRYILPILCICLIALAQRSDAQCTTDAGSLSGPSIAICVNTDFSVVNNGDQVLDADDILVYVAYTGSTPNAGSVFATSTDGNFPWQGAFLDNSPFQVAAVAGNDLGGTVDWNDPCLSVSGAVTIEYSDLSDLAVGVGGILTCATAQVTITATSSQNNLAYIWSHGATTPSTIVNAAGNYSVTVTNMFGCTAESEVFVDQDIAVPAISIGPDVTLDCNNPAGILTATASPPVVTYSWVGPSGFVTNEQSPTVSSPGTYLLIVTDVSNGCTATATVVVLENVIPPLADAGPDLGFPCGGGMVTLSANFASGASISWSGPNGFSSSVPEVDVSSPDAGIYQLTVTGTNGCTATDEVEVFDGPILALQDFSVTDAFCPGSDDGAISITNLSVGQAPFTFAWMGPAGFSSTSQDISNLIAGTYSLIATDATDCNYHATVSVNEPVPMIVAAAGTNPTCPGSNDGSVVVTVFGGTPPYTYNWSSGSTTPDQFGLSAGVYVVTITDANNCTAVSQPVIIVDAPQIVISIVELYNDCSGVGVTANPAGSNPPFAYLWSNGVDGPTNVFTTADTYFLTITDANGCTQIASFTANPNNGVCAYLEGFVTNDTTQNCQYDSGEPGLSGWLVKAEGAQTYYGITDADGKFFIGVPIGDYTVSVITPNGLWQSCLPGVPVMADMPDETFDVGYMPVYKLQDCPLLTVTIGTNVLRRCFSNNYYYINYCNEGTAVAEDASIIITLDPLISPVSSPLPYTDLGNNMLQFDLGDVESGECGMFYLKIAVSCDAVLGQSLCSEAHIYPDFPCVQANPLWSGASISVSSICNTDSVRFFIQNVGAGNMTQAVDYIVVEDAVMLMQGQVILDAGNMETLTFPANGSTWRVEVDQVPFHPGNSQPALSVEGCTTTSSFSMGFLGQFPLDDADPWVDYDCTTVVGSFDPNDKQAFPVGYGASHYIRPGTELEYLIRFQNTGTDTAFTVRVVDTLSAWLDPTTIRPGPSSHDYHFDLSGTGIATFLFENILLPDSNVNLAGSNGFVKFSILPRADAPLETVIENDAAIYFDFNEPVITNTTFHRLGEDFLVGIWQPHVPGAEVSVAPNPFANEAVLSVKGLRDASPLSLQVFNLQGVMIREMQTAGDRFRLQKTDWPAGIYLFHVRQNGAVVGSGKLIVR
ncbi:MAG: T9SS type A sorting domain-containing protein [Lewinellaceae bacterium]|nr:T9SS type A sorting domain-containing protein [Lewinellaceae bacterium]